MRANVGIIMMVLMVSVTGFVCSPAGCNCTDTCESKSLTLCWVDGGGDCYQYWENRCQNGACGGWFPFRDDCYYECEWTNYNCPLGEDCELITSYWMGCVG
ncbi:hypothetical protein JW848_05205 [Candidatus Bipolaricaulota bacterium]|nr:hypothetical protein [Candidatus Bipolaricaulota bacterium]